ncbi:MAG: sigma 54-interacting transcriptional regulator, partial [Spirochaetia bacterium]|nr:sigma 54-interacting transcriptional regulator [Spirochaetia bacterium]
MIRPKSDADMKAPRTSVSKNHPRSNMRRGGAFLATALACLGASCLQGPQTTAIHEWEFRPGFNQKDPGQGTGPWKPTAFPAYFRTTAGFEDYKGWITFRAPIPKEALPREGQPYAVFGGMISDVSRLYFNDTFVGGLGSADPYRSASFLVFLKSLPSTINVKEQGNFLYLCVYTDGTYPIYVMEYPRMGPAEIIYGDYYKSEILSFILLAAYFLVGLYHLHLWVRRRKELYNLYFGLLCIFLCFYWIFRLGSRDIVFGDSVLLRTKLEFIVLFLLGPFLLFFLSQFFRSRHDRFGLVIAPFFAVLAVVTAVGSYLTARVCLTIWQLSAIPTMAYCVFYIAREVYRKNPESKYLIPGVAALMLTGIHDIAAIRGWISTPMIARFAYPVFILGSAAVLARRFVNVHNHVEELLHNSRQQENLRSEFASVEDAGRDIASLLERITVALKNIFGFETAFTVVSDQFGTLYGSGDIPKYMRVYVARAHVSYQRNSLKPEFFEYCGPVFRIDPAVAEITGKTGSALARARATKRVFERLAEDGYHVGISLLNRKEVFGVLVIGPKAGGASYSLSDLSAMQTFQYAITQAVGNSMLFAEVSKLKGEAEDRVEKLSDYVIERSKAVRHEMDEKTLVYSSREMAEVFEKARKYAQASQPILITGETGTGKELVARTIHQFAGNASSPFVAINC